MTVHVGTDFNDIVHPAARCFVEGLFGLRPNLPQRTITVAPQLPSSWDSATVITPALSVNASGFRQRGNGTEQGVTTVAVAVRPLMPCVGCDLIVHLPLRAAELISVTVNGAAASNYTIEASWGQAIVIVQTTVVGPAAGVPVIVSLRYGSAIGYGGAQSLHAIAGAAVSLDLGEHGGTSWSIVSVDDPQGALASYQLKGGVVSAVIAVNRSGFSLVCVNARLLAGAASSGTAGTQLRDGSNASSFPVQRRLFKLNVTDPVAEAKRRAQTSVSLREASEAVAWSTLDLSGEFNGNLSDIFYPRGGYREPRPKTCSARIGTDGWSAWTFTYGQGSKPPRPSFDKNSTGIITTPQGARFKVVAPRVVFVSQWVNYPTHVTISLREAKVQAGDIVWVLISGSTNSMQTRLANARLNFTLADSAVETLELIPPLNYWTLAPIGGIYYDYVRVSAACHPAFSAFPG